MKPTEQNPKTPHTATGIFALLGALLHTKGSGAPKIARGSGAPSSARVFTTLATLAATLLAGAGLTAALPATAGAYATLEGPPTFSSAPGLPDGRVYEQVSPTDTNGNEAGSTTGAYFTGAEQDYGLAAADGDSVLFEGTGPMGESPWGASQYFVASKNRSAAGWSTRALFPAGQQSIEEIGGTTNIKFYAVDPSADLSHVMFASAKGATYAADVPQGCRAELYLSGPDPFVQATWLARPEIPNQLVSCTGGVPVGGTPNFSTVYFTSPGTLLPADVGRTPYAGIEGAWGFYEDSEGTLREAGTLPADSPYPGEPSPFGAVPAASGHGRALGGNQVSSSATRAFFVSPDPAAVGSCVTTEEGKGESAAQAAAACGPQLYVRENGVKTVLVSQDALLPDAGGLPASAPDGVSQMPNTASQRVSFHGSYVFASPDGSQAFFQSEDRLTPDAPEGPPQNTEPKTYDFDLETGVLTYLPGVVGQIAATDTEGTSFAFVRPAAGGSPAELDLWSGPGAGRVTPVTQLPDEGNVPEARMSSDGSVLVFVTSALIAGFNNGGTHAVDGSIVGDVEPGSEQIYRYDVPANTLGCVSCTPPGVTPTGDASFSALRASETYDEVIVGQDSVTGAVDERGISADGDRIFFDTPAPLVPQDANTDSPWVECAEATKCQQSRDLYEWENGVVYLISGGKSSRNSYLLDNSDNGDDVFFATTEALTPGHTDGAYAVYDARVPQPGDNPPATAVPCEGSVCQGPPNVPSPLTPPASATFSGLGNPTAEVTPPPPPAKTTTKTVKCKKGFTKKKNKCVKNKKKTKDKKASHNGRTKS